MLFSLKSKAFRVIQNGADTTYQTTQTKKTGVASKTNKGSSQTAVQTAKGTTGNASKSVNIHDRKTKKCSVKARIIFNTNGASNTPKSQKYIGTCYC